MLRVSVAQLAVVLALAQTAFGGAYEFTVVAQDPVNDTHYSFNAPVMGEDGLVYFPGQKEYRNKVTWGVFAADESSIEMVYDGGDRFSWISTIAVNSNREIAFSAETPSGYRGVYKTDGKALTTLAETNDPAWEYGMPDINASGQVAFMKSYRYWSGPDPVTIFRGDGVGPLTTIEDWGVQYGVPSIDDAGNVAFAGKTPAGTYGEFVGDGSQPVLQFESKERLSSPTLLNDGTLVFRTPDEVLLAKDGSTKVLADKSQGILEMTGVNMPPAYTESGNLVFMGERGGPLPGIGFYTGSNTLTDHIASTYYPILGGYISMISSWSPVNERGQVALWLNVTMPGGWSRQYLVRADPLPAPEPATIVLAAVAVGWLTINHVRRCWRARG